MFRRESRRDLKARIDWLGKRNADLTKQLRVESAKARQWERSTHRLARDFVKRGKQDAEEMARLTDERDTALALLASDHAADAHVEAE